MPSTCEVPHHHAKAGPGDERASCRQWGRGPWGRGPWARPSSRLPLPVLEEMPSLLGAFCPRGVLPPSLRCRAVRRIPFCFLWRRPLGTAGARRRLPECWGSRASSSLDGKRALAEGGASCPPPPLAPHWEAPLGPDVFTLCTGDATAEPDSGRFCLGGGPAWWWVSHMSEHRAVLAAEQLRAVTAVGAVSPGARHGHIWFPFAPRGGNKTHGPRSYMLRALNAFSVFLAPASL